VNKEQFRQHLIESSADDATIDGIVADDTPEATKESAFAPVADAEKAKMEAFMAASAAALDIDGAANRGAIAESVGKKLTRVPVRKISGKEYFKLYNKKEYSQQGVRAIEVKQGMGEIVYLVNPNVELPASIKKEVKLVNIYTGMNVSKEVFLLYIKRSASSWYDSAIEMMRLALHQWVKVAANSAGYDYFPATVSIPEPEWADLPSFTELLALAFRNRMIDSADHLAVRKMLGSADEGSVGDDGALDG